MLRTRVHFVLLSQSHILDLGVRAASAGISYSSCRSKIDRSIAKQCVEINEWMVVRYLTEIVALKVRTLFITISTISTTSRRGSVCAPDGETYAIPFAS